MEKSRGFILGVLCVSLVLLLSGNGVLASASSSANYDYVYLDPSFGVGGKVLTQINDNEFSSTSALVLQPDGKLVVAGSTKFEDTGVDFVLARYNPDGSLDESFGSGGVVSTDFNGSVDVANAITLQEDGKLVAAGCAKVDGQDVMALARYNPDGSLDNTWGGTYPWDADGKVTTNYVASADVIAIQADGRIIAAGPTASEIGPEIGVVRFNFNGSLDPSFNGIGKFSMPADGSARAIVIQPDGKIIISTANSYPGVPLLLRLNADGSLDETFADQGIFTPSPEFSLHALALQADGKLLASGYKGTQNFLVRLNPDGSMDETFGDQGLTITEGSTSPIPNVPFALIVQPDNKIVVAERIEYYGEDSLANMLIEAFKVSRYNSDGSLDTSFNGDGFKILQINPVQRAGDYETGLVLQPDGKLVVAGTVYPDHSIYLSPVRFGLARIMTQSFGLNASVDKPLPDPGQQITCTVTLRNDGPQALTNARISDDLPDGLSLAGTIQLAPAEAGTIGTLPELVKEVSLGIDQTLTVTLPLSVDPELVNVVTLTNTVSMTSTEIPEPFTASLVFQTNGAPVARDDIALVVKNLANRIFVLANDSDPNGQAVSLIGVGVPQHGSAAIDGNEVLYTPEAGYVGSDGFTYMISDGSLGSEATVTVFVTNEVWKTYLSFITNFRK